VADIVASGLCEDLPGFVWVEDDVELCPGAEAHLQAILQWFGGLPSSSDLVYVRTGFGFAGLVVRCARLPEFLAAINHVVEDSSMHHVIDWGVAAALEGRTAVYHRSLFQHVRGESTIWSQEEVERRDAQLGQCFDYNIMDTVPLELFDYPACKGHAMSPCSDGAAPPLANWPVVAPPAFPAPPKQGEEAIRHIVGKRGNSCWLTCRNAELECAEADMERINEDPRLLVSVFDCAKVVRTTTDADDEPMTSKGVCYARLGTPTCSGYAKQAWRLCSCRPVSSSPPLAAGLAGLLSASVLVISAWALSP
jgi:hypothetical protein